MISGIFRGSFWLLNNLQKRCFSTQEFARLSAVSSQGQATRSDVFFQTKWSECLVTVELAPHTYMTLREPQFCPSWSFALHRHGHAEWLRLCQKELFSETFSVKIHTRAVEWFRRRLKIEEEDLRRLLKRRMFMKKCAEVRFFYETKLAEGKT